MAIKRFGDYEKTQSYSNGGKLPGGGYVLKVENVRFEEGKNGNSDIIALMFDVAEGEQKGFFRRNFEAQSGEDKKWKGRMTIYCPRDDGSEQDTWTKRKFKTIMEHFEASNPGYSWNWDEMSLKGKLIGAIFGEINSVIDGKQIAYTGLRFTESAENIRKGNFKIPDAQYKNGASANNKTSEPKTDSNGFVTASGTEEEIPF